MLNKKELLTIKTLLLQAQPTQGRSMRSLIPELQRWQEAIKAVDRELAELQPSDEPARFSPVKE